MRPPVRQEADAAGAPPDGGAPTESSVARELTHGVLALDRVADYLGDLRQCAEVLDVVVRHAARQSVNGPQQIPVEEGVGLLLAGGAAGLQVRYCYAGDEWLDTLIPHEAGLRLVRIRAER